MNITGISLDGNSITSDMTVVGTRAFPDDNVIYLDSTPCQADTVEQVGFSDLLTAAKRAAQHKDGDDGCFDTDYCQCWRCLLSAAIAKAEADDYVR